MATVRMTQTMASDIETAAMKAWHNTNPSPEKNPELQALVRQAVLRMPVITKIKEIADDPVVKELIDGKNTRLTGYLKPFADSSEVSEVFLEDIPRTEAPSSSHWQTVVGYDDQGRSTTQEFTEFNMKIEFDTPIIVPCVDSWMHFDIEYNQLHPDDRLEIATKATEAYVQSRDHSQKESDFRESIQQVIKSCNTVKQLLDVWPAAEKLLSADTIQKLHKKVTRKIDADAVRERANFDPNAANQVILTNSLLGD